MNPNIQQILNKLSAQDEKVRYAIIICVLLMIGIIDYMTIMSFQLGAVAHMNEDIRKITDDTARVKNDLQRINNIQKGLNDMKGRLQAVNSKVHAVQDMPSIFEQLSRFANESHLNIEQLSPSKDPQETLINGPEGKYYAMPIVINAHSGYHMFGRFLSKLEAADVLFLVKDLKMDGSDKDAVNIAIAATLKIILADQVPPADNKTAVTSALEKSFVYDEHGKRDPFAPVVNVNGAITVYDSNLSVVDLSLEGIVADKQGKNVAIINGKIVKVNDAIGPYTVDSISADEVGLVKDQEHFMLKLKRGGF